MPQKAKQTPKPLEFLGVQVLKVESYFDVGNISLSVEWPCIVLPLVLTWYIITELGSILENTVKLGAVVPEWLVKLLKISLNAVNKAGETATADSSQANENK